MFYLIFFVKACLTLCLSFLFWQKNYFYFKDPLNNHNPKKLYSNIYFIIFFVKAYLTSKIFILTKIIKKNYIFQFISKILLIIIIQ